MAKTTKKREQTDMKATSSRIHDQDTKMTPNVKNMIL